MVEKRWLDGIGQYGAKTLALQGGQTFESRYEGGGTSTSTSIYYLSCSYFVYIYI